MNIQNGFEFNAGCVELNQKLSDWLHWDKNDKTRLEIVTMAKKSEWNILRKRLMNRLQFGTAGLRGVMQAGFNCMNDLVIIQTAQGIAKYILKEFPFEQIESSGIVLGYDGRYNSKRFAELSACIFLNAKIPVYLFSKMVATPFIPFTILEKKLLAGIVVTASHNPKEDNGYKVYWQNGSQIITPHDKNIENEILNNLEPFDSSWDLQMLETSDILFDPYEEMVKLYFSKLQKNIPINFINEYNSISDFKFIYSAMHGVGYNYIVKGFEIANLKTLEAVAEQRDADPEFPTVKFPNPEEGKSSLQLSIKLADKLNSDIILANDPDADRLACAERDTLTNEWKVFNGNELGALLGWWSIECYRKLNPNIENLNHCYLLASTVSSKILRAMSHIEGFNFIETLTGFKWMGNKSVELIKNGKTVLFAFEEAIGFMFSSTVLDKDGVSAGCHLATMYCYLRHNENKTLQEKLNDLYHKYGFHHTNNSYFICHDPKIITKIFDRIRNFNDKQDTYPSSICNGKYKIQSIRDLTTGIDTSQADNKVILPCSKSSQMITFIFVNGVVVTLRTSGTEPKIKYYAEMCAKPEEKDWNNLRNTLQDIIDGVIAEFLQPSENNLITRSDD